MLRTISRCEPTYQGLKPNLSTRGSIIPTGCEPTYQGLKREPAGTSIACGVRCEPTYQGLKLRVAFQPQLLEGGLRVYLSGIETSGA